MSKVVRYQFMGSGLLFWLLCITGLGIPLALLYLLYGTVRIDSEMSDPEQFVEEFRMGKLRSGNRSA